MPAVPTEEILQNFLRGMNSNIDPQLLPPDSYAFGLNLTSRGGLPNTRPSIVDFGSTIAAGKFQGAERYRLDGLDRIIYGVAGRVYSLRLDTLAITDHGLLLSSTADRFYFCQADRYMIVQDGDKSTSWANARWPVIINGDTLIDQSSVTNEYERVPKGGPMAFGHGRLFVATDYILENAGSSWIDQGRVGWMAGDVKTPYDPTTLLNFTETWTWDEGGRFDLPQELGFITAMEFQQNIMSGVGQGPLIVIAKNGASAFMINAPRNQWKLIDFGVVLFSGTGSESPLSLVHNNSDLLYRASDGLRTLAQTSSDSEGKGLANDPISEAVDTVLALDDRSTLPRVSGALYDDRLLWTAAPNNDDTFGAILSLDVKAIAALGEKVAPVYDGVWTGLDFQHILTANYLDEERLFIFAQKQDATNGLYVMDESTYADEGTSRPVTRIYTAALQFKSGVNIKKLEYIDLWISGVQGQVDITAYYRPDKYPLWVQADSGTVNSDPTGEAQCYRRLRLNIPDTTEANPTFDLLDRGSIFQFCIQWTGRMQLDKVLFKASVQPSEDFRPLVSESTTATKLEASSGQVAINNYNYRIE